MEYLHQKVKKDPTALKPLAAYTDSKVLQLEVNGICPPGMMDCMFSDKVDKMSSNSVYQTFHLSSVLTETQLPWGECEQTRVSDSSANLPLEEGNLFHYLKVFYSLGVKAFIP